MICTLGRLMVPTMPSSFCPRAAGPRHRAAEDWVKSALPEITAFMAPMPEICTVLMRTPCFSTGSGRRRDSRG